MILVLGTLLLYIPAHRSGYIWDDDFYVWGNETLAAPDALSRIWFDRSASPQYYPLVFTTFWLERQAWGVRPMGYHVTNALLHGLSALLLWRLLRRLAVPGSFLAALIFAFHPVQVESVAWITERKNVLSAVLYLGAASLFLRFALAPGSSRGGCSRSYVASLILFAGALLAKTTASTLPAALLLVIAWKIRRLPRRIVAASTPFFLLGVGLGLQTAWLEKHHVGAEGFEWSLGFFERILVASHALLFYLQKLLLPVNLAFIYPRWALGPHAVRELPYLIGVLALVALLFLGRRRLGWGPLVGFLFFAGTLFPALGFFDVYPFRYSFVADHFQYLATIGPIAVFASGLTWLVGRMQLRSKRAGAAGTGAGAEQALGGQADRDGLPARTELALGLAVAAFLVPLTWHQQKDYRDAETLWVRTLEKNPQAWIAHVNLGTIAVERQKYDIALERFAKAIALRPEEYNSYFNTGSVLNTLRRYGEAVAYLEKSVALFPKHPYAQQALGMAYLRTSRPGASVGPFSAALELKPDWGAPLNALAWVLVAWPDSAFWDPEKGVRLAEQANMLAGGRDPYTLDTMATAYAAAGRFEEALSVLRQARVLAEQAGDQAEVESIDLKTALFSTRQRYREAP